MSLKLHLNNLHINGLLGLLLFSVLVLASFGQGVSADSPSANIDPLVKYCSSLDLAKSAEQACEDNITKARNVATYHCDKDASSDEKVSCVQDTAKGYLKKAAQSSPKPKTTSAYNSAIKDVFDKVHGSTNVPAPGFGSLPEETVGNVDSTDPAADPAAKCNGDDCDFIKKFINPAINTLTACFGIIAVISIIIGGINYATSEGDPQKTSRAKNRIFNTIIAVVAYMFLYAFLQFLVPGGAFK